MILSSGHQREKRLLYKKLE